MANFEQYKYESTGLNSPAYTGESVTPSDDTDLSEPARMLYVGTTGNVSVEMLSGETLVFTGVPAGTFLPVRVTRVNNTGTTGAMSILALR
jgi:hypothetical protein